MSEKYPKIIQHLIEDRGAANLHEPLPQHETDGLEFDNLYIDMNGIIHPCAHPEDRPAPTSELEMYVGHHTIPSAY
jgi:5'-3' exoribonuclease 2